VILRLVAMVYMSFALVCVDTFWCLFICKHLAKTLQSACIELEICLERLTRTRPAEAHLEPADVDELKIRMDGLERLMAHVLNAVDKPLSPTSAAATQTQPQVKTEGYQHRQKPAQYPSRDNPPASSVQARSWESSASQARKTQHNTSWRPTRQTRSSESVNGSFSLNSKTWNPQTSPNSTNFGRSFSKLSRDRSMINQPVRVPDPAKQAATCHKTDNSLKKITVDEAVRMLGHQSDTASGILAPCDTDSTERCIEMTELDRMYSNTAIGDPSFG